MLVKETRNTHQISANMHKRLLQTRIWRIKRKLLCFSCYLCLIWISTANAQDCYSPTFDFNRDSLVNKEISALDVNVAIATHEISNVRDVRVDAMEGYTLYVAAALQDQTKLVISTNELFADFLKTETIPNLFSTMLFTCTSGITRSVFFRVPIKEENLYAPIFSLEEYTIQLPLPLPKNFDLTQYVDDGRGIIAYDYDLTKNDVSFTLSDNPHFLVERIAGTSSKESVARLRTKNTLTRIEDDFSLIITGTDAGIPPKSNTSTLKISGDPTISYIEPPQFLQSLYKTEYKKGEAFVPIAITLQPNTYDTSVMFVLGGEDKDLFSITPKVDRSGATVTLRSGAEIPETKTFASAIVIAIRTGAELDGRTAIVVEVKTEAKLLPVFESPIYTGEVDDTREVSMDTAIKLKPETIIEGVQMQLLGEDAEFFSVAISGSAVSLRASEKLTEEVLKERLSFHFVIDAVKADVGSGIAFIVLKVQREETEVPQFESLYYEGSVTEEGVAQIPDILVMENSYQETLSFDYSGDKELFSITNERNRITLTPNDINEEKLKGKMYLLVRITASLNQTIVAETVVIVKIVRQEVITPEFSNNFILGQFVEKTQVLTPINVAVNRDTFVTESVVNLKDSYNIFELKKTTVPHEFTVNLREGVQIPRESHFTLIVEVTNPKSTTASCFILIEVLPLPMPEFEQLLYEGFINSDNQLEELKLKLKEITYDDTIVFSLIDHNAELFEFRKLETHELSITLKSSTTEEDIANRSNLRFNVRARRTEMQEATVPVVVFIQKGDVQIPKFEKPLYRSSIGTDLQLVPFETIKLVNGTAAEGLELELLLNNTDLFGVELREQGSITIGLKKVLTAEDLEGLARIEFVIEVSNPGVGSGFATIVVDIVQVVVVVPEFTAVFYSGTMEENSSQMVFPEKIMLKAETLTNEVQYIVAGADAELIVVSKNEDHSPNVALKEEVTAEQLADKTEINFVVQANNPGSPAGFSSVVVHILRPGTAAFTKSSFTGDLVEGQRTVNFGADEVILNAAIALEDIILTLTGTNSNYFEASLTDEEKIQISLKSTITWEQIRYLPYITIQLEATNPKIYTASTTIIVNVQNLAVITPVFTKSFYRGALQTGLKEVVFAASEIITLELATVTSTLEFRVIENDHALFDVIREQNKFKVYLKPSVTEDAFEGRDILSFLIEANNRYGATDTTTVIINVPLNEIIIPVFTQEIYRGSIKEGTNNLTISGEVSFQPGSATENTAVGVVADDSEWFTASMVSLKVTITVNGENPIQWDTVGGRKSLSFLVQATNPGGATATATVILEIERTDIVTPKFKASSFRGLLGVGSREVQFPAGGAIELDPNTLLPEYTLELSDNDHQFFDHTVVAGQVQIKLGENIGEDDLRDKLYLTFNVAVTNPGGVTATATVLVDVKQESDPINVPVFEKSVYTGRIDAEFRLILEESIFITEASYIEGVVIGIGNSNSNLLNVTQNQRQAVVELAKILTAEDLQGFSNLHITIQAKSGEDPQAECFLVISVPVEEQETCTPTPPIIDCTDCIDCSTEEPLDDVPVFAYGNYNFHLQSDTIGEIGEVRASAKDPSVVLEHRPVIEDDYLAPKIYLSTNGNLGINEFLLPNEYVFRVTARNSNSGKQSTASVRLDVVQKLECPANPEAPKVTTVERLLVIESLAEESPHLNIFRSQVRQCEYELIDEKPYLGYNYFEIDRTTHWLTSQRFDRENATLFEGMTVPQFQLKLQLICPVPRGDARIVKRSLVETEGLNFAGDVTVLNVIVLDINDHDPRFTNPAGTNINFGFPISSIAAGLMMAQLITVQAEDLDEGLNAKIRYSLNSNNDFAIEPESGRIYPMKHAMMENALSNLIVTATDRDGAADGRTSDITLTVHRLELDHLVTMTVPGVLDAAAVIDTINANSNEVQLKTLIQAKVPSIEQNAERRSKRETSAENVILRLVVYGFNNRNELQGSETIQRIIRSSSFAESATIDSYSDAACLGGNSKCDSESVNEGLIATSAVLGSLFLISAGIAVFLYLRFVRPLSKAPTNPSDIVQLEDDFDVSPQASPLALKAKKAADELDPDSRKISIQITGITDQESEDSKATTNRFARSLDERLERGDNYDTVSSRETLEDTSPTEFKNVKFNEVVERIEVVEHHSDREDVDSIYSERL